jgi:hypothetical protein
LRRLTLTAVVTLLVAYALAGVYGAASAFWQPSGTLGFTTDYGANIRAVLPEGPADRAGVLAGDHIELSRTPLEQRLYIAGVGNAVPIGTVVPVRIIHAGVARDVALTAQPAELTKPERFSLLLQCVGALVFIAVGAALILLRPTPATWGFGLYCLLQLPTADHPFPLLSPPVAIATTLLYDFMQNLANVGLLVFALEFPRPFVAPWRERIRRALTVIVTVLTAMTLYPDVANLLLGLGAAAENRLLQLAFGAVFALAMFILSDTYRRIARDERERLRWVLIGFGLGLLTNFVGTTLIFSSIVTIDAPDWILNVLVSLSVLLPLTVAHAVVRNRVLDINFVISRALVYAGLTTVLAALFGLLDWVFGHMLEEFRISRFIQAGISIAIAFAFDNLHKRTETAVETIFFRARRAAEARLTHLAHALFGARSQQVVQQALVGEVVDALGLTSAALYEKNDSGRFTRSSAHGWREPDCGSLDDADLLVLALRAREGSVNLAELPWRRSDLPGGGLAPIVAVPMESRDELTGFVLYGGHPDGSDIDPAELALLERVAHAASVALEEQTSERLRAENEQANATIRELRVRLDEVRRFAPAALNPVAQT